MGHSAINLCCHSFSLPFVSVLLLESSFDMFGAVGEKWKDKSFTCGHYLGERFEGHLDILLFGVFFIRSNGNKY